MSSTGSETTANHQTTGCREIECPVPQDPFTEHRVQLTKSMKEAERLIKKIINRTERVRAGEEVETDDEACYPLNFPPFPENFPLTRKLKDEIVELYSDDPAIVPFTIICAEVKDGSVKPKTCMEAKTPLLTAKSQLKLIDRTVAFFLHDAGFDTAESEVFRFLTSVLHKYIKDLLQSLNENIDSRKNTDDQKNLEYALEKLFREVGFGGIEGLLAIYQNEVIKKHRLAVENWVQLHKKHYSLRTTMKCEQSVRYIQKLEAERQRSLCR